MVLGNCTPRSIQPGVREDQFFAIAEQRFDDAETFVERERIPLNFGKTILEQGKASGVVFKHTLEHFSIEELADAMIVIGFYRMVSGFIQTFKLPNGSQADAVLLKDLKATFNEGLQHNIPLPFNSLSATQLFHSMGKEKQDAK